MSAQTESTDGWVCAFCSHPNDFDYDDDWAGPPPNGKELPFRCAECGKVCIITAEVVQVRFVAEPADDQSDAMNDEDDFEGEDEDEDEDFDEDDFEEEEEDDFEEGEFDDLDEEHSDGGESVCVGYTVAKVALSDPRHLIELHANNPSVMGAVQTGWESAMPGRVHPACKGLHTVHDGCRGVVEPCARCGRPRCYAEGTSSLARLCDDCWSAVVTEGVYWPTIEAVKRRRKWLREEWAMPRWWMWTTQLAEALADDEADCARIDQINRVVVELPVQPAFSAVSEATHD